MKHLRVSFSLQFLNIVLCKWEEVISYLLPVSTINLVFRSFIIAVMELSTLFMKSTGSSLSSPELSSSQFAGLLDERL